MMNKNQTTWLALSLLLLGGAACAPGTARAGDYDVKDTTSGKDLNLSESGFDRKKWTFTLDARVGYDDNPSGRPDSAVISIPTAPGVAGAGGPTFITRRVDVDTDDSAFVNFALGVGYTAATPRASLTIGADVGVTYYFDRDGRSYDVNGGLSGRFTYKLTPRLFFDLSTYNAFISAGDYGASNLSGFSGTSVAGSSIPGTTADNRDSDYFYTTNRVALSYQFAPRLSLVGSENFVAFAYDDALYQQASDRIETYTGLELQYLLQPNLTLAASYRFGYIDYFNVSNDSFTHFALTGLDYSFNQRLKGSFRVGAEFREYPDAVGDEISPYAEGAITYDINKNARVSLNARYGIEEGVLFTTANSKADTFRIGADYSQNFTARISGYLAVYYTHAQYETLTSSVDNFKENTYDVSAGLRYAINRHLAAEIGYTHTTFDSDIVLSDRSYDRNRYFGGLRVQF